MISKHTTTESIGNDLYLVEHHVEDTDARYILTKPDGTVYACNHNICNCKGYYYGLLKSPAFACKHIKLARKLDSDRRRAYIHKQRQEIMGDVA